MRDRPVANLVINAVTMAVWSRRPGPRLIHHCCDQEAQYNAVAFGRVIIEAGIVGSMGTLGDALDNAVAESFFATLETELLDRCSRTSRQALASVVLRLIGFFRDLI